MIYTTTTCKILAGILAPVAFFLYVTAPMPIGMHGRYNEFSAILFVLSIAGIVADEDRVALLCSGILVGILVSGINTAQPWQGGIGAVALAFCLLVLGVCRAEAAEKKQYS